VQEALANLAARRSTRTVQIAHNLLVRAIRHAGRDDLVGRNVAALVKPPKGQLGGRPSKSLTLEQAVSLMAAARGTLLEAYIALSLLSGIRTEEARVLRWGHVVAWVSGQWVPWRRMGSTTGRRRCSCGGRRMPGDTRRRSQISHDTERVNFRGL
jgi:integrase